MTEAVADRVRAIILDQLGEKAGGVTDATTFLGDLKADSLDLVELIMALEEEFKIDIPEQDAERITSVGDAIRYVGARIAGTDPA